MTGAQKYIVLLLQRQYQCLFTVFFSSFLTVNVFGQCISNASGNWTTPATWTNCGGGIPGTIDDVVISGHTITVNTHVSCNSVTINSNSFSDTRLEVILNVLSVTNDFIVDVNNDNTHTEVEISGSGIMVIGGNVSWDRDDTNTRNRRMQLHVFDNGRMDITGNFEFIYGDAGAETEYELWLEDDAVLDIDGDFTFQLREDGEYLELFMNENALLAIGGEVLFDQLAGDGIRVITNDQSQILANNNFIYQQGFGAANPTNNSIFTMNGSSTLNVTMNMNINQLGNDESIFIQFNDDVSVNVGGNFDINQDGGTDITVAASGNSEINIAGNYSIDKDGGDDYFFQMNDAATFDVAGAGIFNIQSDNNGDILQFNLNGGALVITGASTFTNEAGTGSNFTNIYLDGGDYHTAGCSLIHGGQGDGDMLIALNRNQVVTQSLMNITGGGNLVFEHNDGDNMELEINTNATLTASGAATFNINASTDNDQVIIDLNGGEMSVTGLTTLYVDVAVTDGFIDVDIDGATLNANGGFIMEMNGSGTDDMRLMLNRNSTLAIAALNVIGTLRMENNNEGDDMEIELNTNASITVTGDMEMDLVSNTGDLMLIDINDGVFTVSGDLSVTISGGGIAEDLNIQLDDDGVWQIDGNVTINYNSGDDILLYLNQTSGDNAQFVVGGNFLINKNTDSGDDLLIIVDDIHSLFNVGGDFMGNLHGLGDRYTLDLDGGDFIVDGELALNAATNFNAMNIDMDGGNLTCHNLNISYNGINSFVIDADLGSLLTVNNELSIDMLNGTNSVIRLNNDATLIVNGSVEMDYSGGTGILELEMNGTSIADINGNFNMLSTSAGKLLLDLNNTSTLRIAGDFVRATSPSRFGTLDMDIGATLEFDGTDNAQLFPDEVGSGGDYFDYENVIINNAFGSSPQLVMEGTASVKQNLHFVQGIIASSISDLLILLDNCTVTGASNDSYVDGFVRKVGDDAFVFPIGNAGYYAACEISAPSAISDSFDAQYVYGSPHNAGYDSAQREVTIDHISEREYWLVNRSAGTSSVTVVLSWDDPRSGGVTDLSELLVTRWDGAQWVDQGNGGTTGSIASGTIVSATIISNFSPFTLASTTENNPLPIDLLRFDATVFNESVRIYWETASEINNDYFTVEKSKDGYTIEEVAVVKGSGDSDAIQAYYCLDESPHSGISYYRLKQTDFDGQFEFFEWKTVDFSEPLTVVEIYPNPATDLVQVRTSGTRVASVVIFNENGQRIFSEQNIDKFSVENFPAGVYILNVFFENGRSESFKLVVSE